MTTKQVEQLRDALAAGCGIVSTAKRIGVSKQTASWWAHRLGYYGQRGASKGAKYPHYVYEVRRKKDGVLLAKGSAEECAKVMGLKRGYFYQMQAREKAGKGLYEIRKRKKGEEDWID